MARFASVVSLLLVVLTSTQAMAQECPSQPNVAAIVVGTIAGTLAVVAVIIAIGAFLWWRRQKKAKQDAAKQGATKRNGTKVTDHVYENPNFQADVEGGLAERKPDGGKGFGGYVECRELEASRVQGRPGESNGGNRMLFAKSSAVPKHRHGYGLHKAGSRGSLDNSLPNLEPEVISVLLESRDPIGLGFDICGSMRDGIYVSQVHNRGPAIETGLVKIGDRVLSMTISFENMVLEDALTIISYASPYPVRVLLQKAASLEDSESLTNGQSDLQHSLYYRSQSLNDLSQISKDGLMGPRRAFSDMRTLPMERNKKWAGNHGDIHEKDESEMVQQRASDASIEIHEMKIDSSDLMCESSEVNSGEVMIKVSGDDDRGNIDDKEKRDALLRKQDEPPEEDSMQKLSVEDKLAVIRLSYENPEDSDIDSAATGGRTNDDVGSKPLDSSNISMDVNLSEDSILMRDEPTIPLESSSQEQGANGQSQKLALRVEDEGVRAVLRDYFSGQPGLMEQFGISEQSSGNTSDMAESQPTNIMVERQSLEVEDIKMRSSEESTPSSSFDIQDNADLKDGARSDSPVLKWPSGGLSFEVTPTNLNQSKAQEKEVERKGGMAYYVRMEEQHNPIPEIYNFPFPKMGDISQPLLIDVSKRDDVSSALPVADCDIALENNNVSDAESIAQKKRVIHPSPMDLSDENGYGDDDDGKSTPSRNSSNVASEKGTSLNAKAKLSVEDITVIRCDDTQAAYIATVQSDSADETEA